MGCNDAFPSQGHEMATKGTGKRELEPQMYEYRYWKINFGADMKESAKLRSYMCAFICYS